MILLLCIIMLLVALGHCASNSAISPGTSLSRIISFSVVGAVLLMLVILFFVCSPRRARRRRTKREEMIITAFNEHPQPARVPLAQDHDSENHNLDSNPDSGSPTTVSEAPTVRQQHIRAQSQSVTARIADLEGLVPRLQDAEAEIQRLRAENLRLRDQEQSDWALEVSDSPPPSYRETGTT
ncbi:hypothetical protein C8J56DRAFT_467599 [Mycena floridula]|nr:hypothetical protein C8J56DRAFT_467599 [Mycena floridula]